MDIDLETDMETDMNRDMRLAKVDSINEKIF